MYFIAFGAGKLSSYYSALSFLCVLCDMFVLLYDGLKDACTWLMFTLIFIVLYPSKCCWIKGHFLIWYVRLCVIIKPAICICCEKLSSKMWPKKGEISTFSCWTLTARHLKYGLLWITSHPITDTPHIKVPNLTDSFKYNVFLEIFLWV